MKLGILVIATALLLGLQPGFAQTATSGVDRLYVLDCGTGHAADQSRWSPGVNVGKPFDISGNCYLIHHAQGYLLWDTGVPDAVAAMADGQPGQNGAPSWRRAKTLAGQLEEIGVKPSDVRYLAVSHTHPDHIGNVELFPGAMLLVQKAEYDWPSPLGVGRFKPEHPVTKLAGDHDVFGDGSVTIISTPGHTPGHQCLLVKLPHTGTVLLSGDAVHFKDNWDNRRVPAPNTDKDQTLASMQRMADVLAQNHAELWINHDKAQTASQKHSPQFYD
ncbi:MAG TPA: N-acyl homoserine lactonase family protein [Xanthobacteraceae bacterium]|jgi:N-acyl homoserine lactone hydrolase|nr:N-acyl homoserine lactonase family protein [Xanthobacteraceae bacterium]